ncbi:MAG: RNA methyltransferase [bacterium]
MTDVHPRDRLLTIYGRKPVLEVVEDPGLPVERVLIARNADGPVVADILKAARKRGLDVRRVTPAEVTRLSRNARQDQGAVADVVAPRMGALGPALPGLPADARVLLLDGLTTPGNIGLLLRAATAAGWEGIIVPRRGSPEVGPLVIKASAGVAFKAPILRTATAEEAANLLKENGFELCGLRASDAADLYQARFSGRVAFVLGNESTGLSPAVDRLIDRFIALPMAGGVESLNVAIAGAVVAYELCRRRLESRAAVS